jgi:hypothetical protein
LSLTPPEGLARTGKTLQMHHAHIMTAEEFTDTLAAIGWPQGVLAARLGMGSDRAVRRWAAGQNPVPPGIVAWLRQLTRTLEKLPPPAEWGTR